MNAPAPLYLRALRARRAKCLSRNQGARARIALWLALARAGADVGLVAVHRWTRLQQGRAYLWAMARLEERSTELPPPFVLRALAGQKRRRAVSTPDTIATWICGEALCYDEATHTCAVIGGPELHFCADHAKKMVEAAREAGVASKITMRPPVPESETP